MEKAFATLHSDIDLRHAQLLGDVDNVKKVTMKEKDEAEYAAAEFAGFCSFTEGLLTQGTPLEIAGSHKEASAYLFSSCFLFFSSCLNPCVFPPSLRFTPETRLLRNSSSQLTHQSSTLLYSMQPISILSRGPSPPLAPSSTESVL